MERKLNGKSFRVKEGMKEEYTEFIRSTKARKVSTVEVKKILEHIDPATALLVIGCTAWMIRRAVAQKLEEKYIEYN